MTSQLKNYHLELAEPTSVGLNCSILTGLKAFLILITQDLVEPRGIHFSLKVIFIKNTRSSDRAAQRLMKKM